jgi:hypothetical protein
MRLAIRTAVIATMGAATLGLSAFPALAHGDDGGRYGGGYGGVRAASYINPDNGMPTENPDVRDDSSCARPDQKDRQRLSDPGQTNRNVHNDACFLDGKGQKVNGPASFQSSGAGYISACPDPDGGGPEYAKLSDTDGDGRMDLCFQSSYQTTGKAGDLEFHARLNNDSRPGTQYVVWCADADRDGCRDERVKDDIRITWTKG